MCSVKLLSVSQEATEVSGNERVWEWSGTWRLHDLMEVLEQFAEGLVQLRCVGRSPGFSPRA